MECKLAYANAEASFSTPKMTVIKGNCYEQAESNRKGPLGGHFAVYLKLAF